VCNLARYLIKRNIWSSNLTESLWMCPVWVLVRTPRILWILYFWLPLSECQTIVPRIRALALKRYIYTRTRPRNLSASMFVTTYN
jgi:hypothetical protein